ncbi:NAD(P)-binding domain containing protein, partial [Trema orientale]
QWYALSKTLAEEVAWKFARENRIDLVTVHPGVVIGPPLQATISGSVKLVLNQSDGIVWRLTLLIALAVSHNMIHTADLSHCFCHEII